MLTKGVAAIALLIASTRALDTSGLPSCGVTCVENAVNDQTTCSSTDLSCLCGDNALGENIGYCLGSTCDSVDIDTTLEWIHNLCLSSSSGETATTATAALFTAVSADATATVTIQAGSTGSSSTIIEPSQQGSGGLSSGAKVGIGVGVPLGVLAIAGGILVAYLLGRKKRGTPTANASYVEEQPTAQAPQQPPTPFVSVPVATEKFANQPTVTEIYPPQPQPTPQPQSGVPVTAQATEKLVVPPAGQPGYSPQQPVSAISSVSPVSTYQDAAFPPPAYAQPQPQPIPQPNAYGVPGNMAPQQSTIAQPQFSQVYEAPVVPPQYVSPSVSTVGSPPPINMVYEAPTNAPGVTGSAELPANQ